MIQHCPNPCNTKYEFPDREREYSSSNTYCPKCRSSLVIQHLQKEFNDTKGEMKILTHEEVVALFPLARAKRGIYYTNGRDLFITNNVGELLESGPFS